MLEIIELLAGVALTVAVIAGGWAAVSWILANTGTGADAMAEMLTPGATDTEHSAKERVLTA